MKPSFAINTPRGMCRSLAFWASVSLRIALRGTKKILNISSRWADSVSIRTHHTSTKKFRIRAE